VNKVGCSLFLIVLLTSNSDPQNRSFSVHVHGGMVMQPFQNPLQTSHPLVEQVRWQRLHDKLRLWSPCNITHCTRCIQSSPCWIYTTPA